MALSALAAKPWVNAIAVAPRKVGLKRPELKPA